LAKEAKKIKTVWTAWIFSYWWNKPGRNWCRSWVCKSWIKCL